MHSPVQGRIIARLVAFGGLATATPMTVQRGRFVAAGRWGRLPGWVKVKSREAQGGLLVRQGAHQLGRQRVWPCQVGRTGSPQGGLAALRRLGDADAARTAWGRTRQPSQAAPDAPRGQSTSSWQQRHLKASGISGSEVCRSVGPRNSAGRGSACRSQWAGKAGTVANWPQQRRGASPLAIGRWPCWHWRGNAMGGKCGWQLAVAMAAPRCGSIAPTSARAAGCAQMREKIVRLQAGWGGPRFEL